MYATRSIGTFGEETFLYNCTTKPQNQSKLKGLSVQNATTSLACELGFLVKHCLSCKRFDSYQRPYIFPFLLHPVTRCMSMESPQKALQGIKHISYHENSTSAPMKGNSSYCKTRNVCERLISRISRGE